MQRFSIATNAPQPPRQVDLRDEHIASRKGWVRYVYLKTEVNRGVVQETDDFIAHVQTRLKEAKRRA